MRNRSVNHFLVIVLRFWISASEDGFVQQFLVPVHSLRLPARRSGIPSDNKQVTTSILHVLDYLLAKYWLFWRSANRPQKFLFLAVAVRFSTHPPHLLWRLGKKRWRQNHAATNVKARSQEA